MEAARKAIDPEKHDVNDRTKRPDKRVAVSDSEESSGLQVTSDVPGGSKGTTRPEPVARISLAIQQLIIKRAVSFLFGNDPAYNADTESEQQQAVMRAFGRILREVKCNSINRCVGRLRTPAKFAGSLCVGTASAEVGKAGRGASSDAGEVCLVPVCRGVTAYALYGGPTGAGTGHIYSAPVGLNDHSMGVTDMIIHPLRDVCGAYSIRPYTGTRPDSPAWCRRPLPREKKLCSDPLS